MQAGGLCDWADKKSDESELLLFAGPREGGQRKNKDIKRGREGIML